MRTRRCDHDSAKDSPPTCRRALFFSHHKGSGRAISQNLSPTCELWETTEKRGVPFGGTGADRHTRWGQRRRRIKTALLGRRLYRDPIMARRDSALAVPTASRGTGLFPRRGFPTSSTTPTMRRHRIPDNSARHLHATGRYEGPVAIDSPLCLPGGVGYPPTALWRAAAHALPGPSESGRGPGVILRCKRRMPVCITK